MVLRVGFKIYIYIHTIYFLVLAVLGLRCTSFSLVAGSGGYSLVVACRLLIAVASLRPSTGSRCVGFSSQGAGAELLQSTWDLLRPGNEPCLH